MINKTPIMTNEGYKINDIKLNFDLINEKKEFNNISISSNFLEDITNKNISSLEYGLGNNVIKNNEEYNNSNLFFTTVDKADLNINYNFDDNNTNLCSSNEIVCKHDLNMNLVFESLTDSYNMLNNITKITVQDGANVNLNIVNFLNKESNSLFSIEVICNDNSSINLNVIDLGSLNSIQNIYLKTKGTNSKINLNSLYMANNNEIKDLNYISHLCGEKSIVDMKIEGSLNDTASKSFKGTIDFKNGCFKSSGEESENCILLSPNVISKSLPILLCSEEDVSGAHSSSSGSIDEEKIYYLQTRGIDKMTATKLVLKSNFSKILDRIEESEDLKNKINEEIDRRL
ncbi:MAG: SufD family Fe-S cluster assembly protein [bacterium]